MTQTGGTNPVASHARVLTQTSPLDGLGGVPPIATRPTSSYTGDFFSSLLEVGVGQPEFLPLRGCLVEWQPSELVHL